MSTTSTTSTGLVSSNGTELIAGASYTDGKGIDVSETVDAILEADAAPETAWENDQTTITNQESALKTLQSDIATLQTDYESLSDTDGVFSGLTATSSDSSAVSATTSSSASTGSYQVVVSSLASCGESYSNELTSDTISSGSLVFTIGGGSSQTIDIPADTTSGSTTTLSEAASYINKQNLGITASVVTDSGGSRLTLTSTSSGSAASVSVQSAPDGLTFTNVAGTNASLTVNGVPINSSSNKVSSAITGVTLTLTGTTSSSGATIAVAADTSQIASAVSSFISDYNTIITDLNSQFQYNAGVAEGTTSSSSDSTSGVLEDDSTARLIQDQLLSAIPMSGGDSTSSSITALSQLGITMNDDGTLTLDSSTLENELSSSYSDVQNFFQSASTSSFSGNFSTLMSNLTDSTGSAIVLDLSSLKANYTADEDNITNLQSQLADLKTTLTTQYSALNVTLQMYPTTLDEIETELGYRDSSSDSSSS
jgi:flagellar hook-associated protein 2